MTTPACRPIKKAVEGSGSMGGGRGFLSAQFYF